MPKKHLTESPAGHGIYIPPLRKKSREGHAYWNDILDKNYAEEKFGKAKAQAMKILMARVKAMRAAKNAKLKEDITQAIGDGSSIAGVNKDDVPGPARKRHRVFRRKG